VRRAQARRRSPGGRQAARGGAPGGRQAARGRPLGRLSSAGPVSMSSRFGTGWSYPGTPAAALVLPCGVAFLRHATRYRSRNEARNRMPPGRFLPGCWFGVGGFLFSFSRGGAGARAGAGFWETPPAPGADTGKRKRKPPEPNQHPVYQRKEGPGPPPGCRDG